MTVERIVVDSDSTYPDTPIIRDASGNIVVDYSKYLERIAIAVETMSSNTTAIKNSLATLVTNSTQLNSIIDAKGIKMNAPYDWVGLISAYKLYVEDTGAIGLDKLTEYYNKINALPRTPTE